MKLPKAKFLSKRVLLYFPFAALVALSAYLILNNYATLVESQVVQSSLKTEISKAKQESFSIKQEDQYKKNQKLEAEITAINKTYKDAISVYEKLTDLKARGEKTEKLDADYAQIVKFLADKNYASASAIITSLSKQIDEQNAKVSASTPKSGSGAVANAKESNELPGEGYSRQSVKTENGSFTVDIIAANLSTNKVIIDTASDSDCGNDCPVKSLGDYASRSGAWAGINGNFFCPQEYPSCAGKTNSFDTLLMNKNKHYFNSDNNVYSTVPAAIFMNGSFRFVGQSLQWGRDTSPDAVIANYPLLIAGGNIVYTEPANEPKFGAKGARCFIAGKGNMVYIGVIRGATMGESAQVLKALGVQEALNLDEGGSTALWYQGRYLAGPGRNIPSAVLFVKR